MVMLYGFSACVGANDVQSHWSGNVTVASQYVSRGFQQSWGHPALQAGVEYPTPAEWFAGSWVSTISPYAIDGGHAEIDLYAGKRGRIGDVSYRATLYAYIYPGAKITAAETSYNYSEFVVSLEWHRWSLAYSLTVSRDYFGDNSQSLGIGNNAHSRGSGYLDLGHSFDLGKGSNLALHYGWQRVSNFSSYNWQDVSATVSRRFAGFDIALTYSRAWNEHGVYRLHFSDPASGAWYLTVDHDF
jgi:uncharacterized protein (TIGR02001 family)